MRLPRYFFSSLRFRVLAVGLAIVVALFVATLINTHRALRQLSIDNARTSLSQIAEALNLAVVPNTTRQGLPIIRDYFQEMISDDEARIAYIALLDDKQQILLHTAGTPSPLPDTSLPLEQQIDLGMVHASQPILVFDNGVGSLRYGLSTAHATQARQRVIAESVLALGVALALVTTAMVVVGVRLNRRITRLVSATDALAKGDLSARARLRGNDELAMLAQVFNQMAQSIQDRVADSEAKRTEISALNQDLERRVAERTADLQEMVTALESFNRSVSHDLRGPLGGIAGLAQMAGQALDNNDDSVARRALPMIAKQAEASTQMLSSLLTLARVSDAALHLQPVALTPLVREVIDQIALAQPARTLPEVVIDDMPTITADPELLRPVFTNLIGNAIKFSSQGVAPRIEVGAHRQEGGTTVFVKDNGPGFEPTAAASLFEPFVRLKNTSTAVEGHGVGLSIVRRAVQRHGGRVWADGHPGLGACFYFSVPDAALARPA